MWPYLIIFGTRGVTYNHGEGNFHCPSCGDQTYKQKRVRRFFTLYFIPLIPLDLLGEYVECDQCRDTYKPAVLELAAGPGDAEFEAEFQIAVKRVMVLMALADGVVDPNEVTMICDIFGKLAKRPIDEHIIRAEIDQARADGRTVEQYVSGVVGMLNDSGKEIVVRAAFMVAAADGEIQDEETELMTRIGKALQMTSAHLNGVISELLSSLKN